MYCMILKLKLGMFWWRLPWVLVAVCELHIIPKIWIFGVKLKKQKNKKKAMTNDDQKKKLVANYLDNHHV